MASSLSQSNWMAHWHIVMTYITGHATVMAWRPRYWIASLWRTWKMWPSPRVAWAPWTARERPGGAYPASATSSAQRIAQSNVDIGERVFINAKYVHLGWLLYKICSKKQELPKCCTSYVCDRALFRYNGCSQCYIHIHVYVLYQCHMIYVYTANTVTI